MVDRRRLVDDEEAVLVGEHQRFLCIRIMRRAEAVRVDPFEELEIAHQHHEVEAAAVQHEVFVLAEALQKDGLAVE